jgi:hypothetical protein
MLNTMSNSFCSSFLFQTLNANPNIALTINEFSSADQTLKDLSEIYFHIYDNIIHSTPAAIVRHIQMSIIKL